MFNKFHSNNATNCWITNVWNLMKILNVMIDKVKDCNSLTYDLDEWIQQFCILTLINDNVNVYLSISV